MENNSVLMVALLALIFSLFMPFMFSDAGFSDMPFLSQLYFILRVFFASSVMYCLGRNKGVSLSKFSIAFITLPEMFWLAIIIFLYAAFDEGGYTTIMSYDALNYLFEHAAGASWG